MATVATKKPLDLRGLSCVFVLDQVHRHITSKGGELEVLVDHPTAIHETIPEYCACQGYGLDVQPEIYPLDGQVYRLRISPSA